MEVLRAGDTIYEGDFFDAVSHLRIHFTCLQYRITTNFVVQHLSYLMQQVTARSKPNFSPFRNVVISKLEDITVKL